MVNASLTENKELTCFISADTAVNLETIEKLLLEKNVKPITLQSVIPLGTLLLDYLRKVILDSDLYIAVISDSVSNINVLIELGIAIGCGKKPLVVFPESNDLPLEFKDLNILKTDANNRNSIDLALNYLLNEVRGKKERIEPFPIRSRPIKQLADELITQLNSLTLEGVKVSEHTIVHLLHRAIEESGGFPVITPKFKTEEGFYEIDMLIWDSEVSRSSPIVVEIQRRFDTKIIGVIKNYIYSVDSNLGLVISASEMEKVHCIMLEPGINLIFISIRDFLQRLRDNSFAAVITSIIKDEG